MDELVKRVLEARDSQEMAGVLRQADPAALEGLEAVAAAFWNRPDLDRAAASALLLRLATGFALEKHTLRALRLTTMLVDSGLAAGDRAVLGPALGTLGVLLVEAGETTEARRVLEEVLILSEGTGDALSRARALHNLGLVEAMEGHDARAVSCFEEAHSLATASGDGEVARLAGRFLELARPAPETARKPPEEPPAQAAAQPCPHCQGKGLVPKEDYGMVLCPACKGACQV